MRNREFRRYLRIRVERLFPKSIAKNVNSSVGTMTASLRNPDLCHTVDGQCDDVIDNAVFVLQALLLHVACIHDGGCG